MHRSHPQPMLLWTPPTPTTTSTATTTSSSSRSGSSSRRSSRRALTAMLLLTATRATGASVVSTRTAAAASAFITTLHSPASRCWYPASTGSPHPCPSSSSSTSKRAAAAGPADGSGPSPRGNEAAATAGRPPRQQGQQRRQQQGRRDSGPPAPSGGIPELPPLEANGFLAVYKPQDWTSNDVVQKIRGVLEKEARRRAGRKVSIKVGHGGTLDPLATGVLVIGVGTACRDLGTYLKGSKGYRAVGMLGAEYDTMDCTGQVTEEVDVSHLQPADLEGALPQFRGAILQKPPAFSAIKKGGKRLYELARQGEAVEVEARPVQVDRLELVMEDEDGQPLAWPRFGLEIECGGGTYVRSLISDLARAVGARAHMTALRRTKQGPFLLKHCLEEAKWRADPEAIVAHLVQQGPAAAP